MSINITDREDTSAAPRLALGHSYWALGGLSEQPLHYAHQLTKHGFEFIEVGLIAENLEPARRCKNEFGLKIIGHGWADGAEEAKSYISDTFELGGYALNLQLGHAYMSAQESADLANKCHELCAAAGLLLLVETHRGKMTQDLYRTSEWVSSLSPHISMNLDVSHYIVAGEGFGGSKEFFFKYLDPLLAQTKMIHARIGDKESVQSDIGVNGESPIVELFFGIWVKAMRRWRETARAGDLFVFEPELGPPPYAQVDLTGNQISDRWQQSLLMGDLGRRAWLASEKECD